MSAFVTEITQRVLIINPTGSLIAAYGVVLIALLVSLMLLKELVRAADGPRLSRWLSTLDVVIMPLVIAYGIFFLLRMINLVRFG